MSNSNAQYINLVLTALLLLPTGFSAYMGWRQYMADHKVALVMAPGTLPITDISVGEHLLSLETINTSKSNIQYILRVETNLGPVFGEHAKPTEFNLYYESQLISLGGIATGQNRYRHDIMIDARPGAVEAHPLAYISDSDYYISVEVLNAHTGQEIFLSNCYYVFFEDSSTFTLHQPIFDGGEAKKKQVDCRA